MSFFINRFALSMLLVAAIFFSAVSVVKAANFPSSPVTVEVRGKPYNITGGGASSACVPNPAGTCKAKVKIMPTGAVILLMPQSTSNIIVGSVTIAASVVGTDHNFVISAQVLTPSSYNANLGGYPLQYTLN